MFTPVFNFLWCLKFFTETCKTGIIFFPENLLFSINKTLRSIFNFLIIKCKTFLECWTQEQNTVWMRRLQIPICALSSLKNPDAHVFLKAAYLSTVLGSWESI